jgi:hypothetical protein
MGLGTSSLPLIFLKMYYPTVDNKEAEISVLCSVLDEVRLKVTWLAQIASSLYLPTSVVPAAQPPVHANAAKVPRIDGSDCKKVDSRFLTSDIPSHI